MIAQIWHDETTHFEALKSITRGLTLGLTLRLSLTEMVPKYKNLWFSMKISKDNCLFAICVSFRLRDKAGSFFYLDRDRALISTKNRPSSPPCVEVLV